MAISETLINVSDIDRRKTRNMAKPSGPSLGPSAKRVDIDIVDIRHDTAALNLKDEIIKSLRREAGAKKLPTLLLYDERGLQLFEEITYLHEYFLTNAEIDVLQNSAQRIAETIPSGSMVVELGSGNLRKVSILLQALDDAGKDIDYYALDLSLKELERTLGEVPSFRHVRCHGLHGTYDDGLDWLKLPENRSRPKCIMSLGSSIGNFTRQEAREFLKGWSNALQKSDSMLIGLDTTQEAAKVYHAYNDEAGVTHKFILNGLTQANEILDETVFRLEDWKVIGEYVYDDEGGRHQAFYAPVCDVHYKDIVIKAGERIQVEQSFKYSAAQARHLWDGSGLDEVEYWSAPSDAYGIHLLVKHIMPFSPDPKVYAASAVPALDEWQGLWDAWDTVTRDMLPEAELTKKPIKLRNACIFYLGHIPVFMDIQLTKSTSLPPLEPTQYQKIFERGIDPDVDNPEHCHAHSEIPDEWPPLRDILDYQDRLRAKVRGLYGTEELPRNIARALWLGFEHEGMHLETLLYMLLQSDKTLPPTRSIPDFGAEAENAKAARVPNEWFKVPEQDITIGLSDPEDNSAGKYFGWDNEKPPRPAHVPAFMAQGRPLTNEDYARYLQQTHQPIPASWAEQKKELQSTGNSGEHSPGFSDMLNGYTKDSILISQDFLDSKSVRTVYGLVPLKFALDWPVFASYDELAGCAKWMDGRIPTLEEARSIYCHVDRLKLKEAEQQLGKPVPAVNAHLSNNGVEETPPTISSRNGESSEELFTNLAGANIGFKHWHPVAITANGNRLAGQGEMGGVWEWTSSPLEKHEGFEPMPLYPAYTADFFDGKHNVVLGGSWATHPRIAGRKSVVNWYQRNYPYVWAGARLVRDL